MPRNVMAPSVAKAMNDIQLVERLQMLEELAARIVANQTDLTSLMRSQQSNGVLYSGMVSTLDDGTGVGIALLDFPVPYAGVVVVNHTGGEWYASNFQTVGVPNATSPGGTFAGLVHTTRSFLAFHLAGQRLQIATPSGGGSEFYVAVYSDPRMISPAG